MTEQQTDRERLLDMTEALGFLGDRPDLCDEVVSGLWTALDQAEARLQAVRDLHRPYGDTLTGLYVCTACDQPYPCPTTRALEGEE